MVTKSSIGKTSIEAIAKMCSVRYGKELVWRPSDRSGRYPPTPPPRPFTLGCLLKICCFVSLKLVDCCLSFRLDNQPHSRRFHGQNTMVRKGACRSWPKRYAIKLLLLSVKDHDVGNTSTKNKSKRMSSWQSQRRRSPWWGAYLMGFLYIKIFVSV